MMRNKLVMTTAIAALVAGTGWAIAQGTQQAPGGMDRGGSQMQTQTPGQPGMGQSQQTPSQREGQAPGQRNGQSAQQGGGGNVTITSEQRAKIRETVLQGGNVPRTSNVNFSLTVGTAVPSSVRTVEVPPTLVEIRPEWRGHLYFVVGDQLIIVDRNQRIVAVLSV